jgi:nuclear pore complex protein Nup98-Nup96
MQKLEKMPSTKWLGFHNPTGTWRFRVEHFSRYGLIDDDSDEEADERLVPQRDSELGVESDQIEEDSIPKDSFAYVKKRHNSQFSIDSSSSQESQLSDIDSPEFLSDIETYSVASAFSGGTEREKEGEDVAELNDLDFTHKERKYLYGSMASSRIQQRDMARKVQTMKSLFSTPRDSRAEMELKNSYFSTKPMNYVSRRDDDTDRSSKRDLNRSSPNQLESRHDFAASSFLSKTSENLTSPKKYRKSCTEEDFGNAIPQKSIQLANEKEIVDAGLFMSRSFRVGWGPSLLIRCR